MSRIKLNETVDRKREVLFALVDRANPDLRIAGHAFVLGEMKLKTPGVAKIDLPTAQIHEYGGGDYGAYLTDAQVALAGVGFIEIDGSLAAAIPNTLEFEIFDPADFLSPAAVAGTTTLLPAGPVTLADLEQIIRERGDYLSSLTYTSTYVRKEIQAAWNEFYELMDDTNEGWWNTELEVFTVASQAYIALPADCWRVKALDILDGTEWCDLHPVPIGYRNRSKATDRPQYYRMTARGADLAPVPNGVYTLRFTYAPKCPQLDDDSAIELYGWQEFIIERALLAIDERAEKPLNERWKRLYDPEDGLKTRIKRGAQKRQQQEPEYLSMRGGYVSDEEWY
jgi:hypothetical protein